MIGFKPMMLYVDLILVTVREYRCLQSMIDNCGPAFSQYIDQDLLDLVFQSLRHTNRFVRETGYYVCASIVACGLTDGKL